MKDKEKLLSFEHAAEVHLLALGAAEGWDNPNVFQICALREMGTERERRQTIGPRLRLCVNQEGERVRGFEVNTLTVIATESYEEFAENLQKEIEDDTGIRFGIVEQHQFAAIAVTGADGSRAAGLRAVQGAVGAPESRRPIDAKGKVQDSLRKALKDGSWPCRRPSSRICGQVAERCCASCRPLEIKNADERERAAAQVQDPQGRAAPERVQGAVGPHQAQDHLPRAVRQRQADDDCIKALQRPPRSPRPGCNGARPTSPSARPAWRQGTAPPPPWSGRGDIELPDLLTDLQDRTQLTRRSIIADPDRERRLDDFKRNPQQFIEQAAEIINRCKRWPWWTASSTSASATSLLRPGAVREEELSGYLKNMLIDTKRSRSTSTWSTTRHRADFAEDLEKNEAVKVYAKLPGWFKVPTPLGTYNPDWAVLVDKDGRSACTSWSKPRAACSPTTCATRRAPRSNAARRTSRRWRLVRRARLTIF
jgi:type III restriction enzyme